MIILGIDPGTATTGYGIVKKEGNSLTCLKYGVIKTSPDLEAEARLKQINQEVLSLISEYSPNVLAIESLFFFKNLKTVMPVSQARGVILMAASQKKIPVFNYTPLQAKMATVGYGRADKKQVQEMVKVILELEETPKPDDAADALAIALCHASINFGLE
jgi:crossover junction endodeoxyribonuclease RuvC